MIILEGCDLVGKSTAIKLINGMFPVQDRLKEFTDCITPDGVDLHSLHETVNDHLDKLFIILVIDDDNILLRRLELRPNADEFDLECLAYNRGYIAAAEYLKKWPNVRTIEVGGMNKFEKTAKIFETYIRYLNPNVVERTI